VGGATEDTKRRNVATTITIATHNIGDEGRKKRTRKREGVTVFLLKEKKNKRVKE
jgi:hypothetical protein